MANVNLRAFTVLVIDQDDAHRWMLHNAMEALGVGEVLTANTNEDALALLKRLTKREVAERVDTVDVMIADLSGQPLDGINLVRWLRMHPESPNRFLPAIMMAKSFGHDVLTQARGYGATHFLPKPITVETLTDRILRVINRPRPFVYTGAYFGPDRRGIKGTRREEDSDRRSADRDKGNDRREKSDRRDETERKKHLVRSPLTDALEHFPQDNLLRIFRPPNHLKRKAGVMGEEDGLFSEGTFLKAQSALEKSRGDYADTAMDAVESLQRIIAEAQKAKDTAVHFQRLHGLAAQLGLQGDTFDYPLVTTVANSLARFTAEGKSVGGAGLDLVRVHVDTLTVVLRNRVTGDGGDVGRQLVAELQAAIRRLSQGAAD